MTYIVEFKPRALKDLKSIDHTNARHIVEKIELMKDNLTGDVNVSRTFRRSIGCALAAIEYYSR
jgi:mRNA-degrading endonuclease RelE of RelBE toxin-antitoxin system